MATSVIVELTMDSEDSTIYPGVDRRPGVEGAADSATIHDARAQRALSMNYDSHVTV